MPAQSLPSTARSYSRMQRREIAAALAAIAEQWRRIGMDFDAGWALVGPQILTITSTAQTRVAREAQAYVPAVLEDTGQTKAIPPAARTTPAPLVGVTGDGRPVDSLLHQAIVYAKSGVKDGLTGHQALKRSQDWLDTVVGTTLADTARQSETLGMGVRPVGGYVRMMTPPSCSRCVVLAGRYYRKNAGFQRHPGCDCRHIPASEGLGDDMLLDPKAYFEGLTAAEQDRVFTKAGAEAIRNGADVSKVVNARRGMTKSQSGRLVRDQYGVYTTTEGTAAAARAARRAGRPAPVRLMPETIAELAHSQDEYLRLLRANGYLL